MDFKICWGVRKKLRPCSAPDFIARIAARDLDNGSKKHWSNATVALIELVRAWEDFSRSVSLRDNHVQLRPKVPLSPATSLPTLLLLCLYLQVQESKGSYDDLTEHRFSPHSRLGQGANASEVQAS